MWLLGRPLPALVLLGASIPITYSLTGGSGGFNLSPSDLLLVFLGASLFFRAVVTGSVPGIANLREVKAPIVQYSFFMALLLAVHLSVSDFFKTGQRFELFLLPLVVGAFAVATNRDLAVLKAYVIAATALAALWPFMHSLGQKNPVGQMIANAVLLLVGVRPLRRYARCAVVLVPGLILTGSRGAVLAAAVGLVVVLMLQSSRTRGTFARAAVLGALAFATFSLLPTGLQSRLTTFTPGTTSRGAYALRFREQFATSAMQIIRAHPIVGIGVGNYRPNTGPGGPPQDPHDVILLQAAEGGWAFAASFVVLIGGVALALRRMREVEIAPVAGAVMVATVAHGLVDVYWVRATPVLCVASRRHGLCRLREGENAREGGGSVNGRDVHVVIVAYQAPARLEQCLDQLALGSHVTVVDNSSSPAVSSVVSRAGARYIDTGANLGFAAGVNVGLRRLLDGEPTDVLLLQPRRARRSACGCVPRRIPPPPEECSSWRACSEARGRKRGAAACRVALSDAVAGCRRGDRARAPSGPPRVRGWRGASPQVGGSAGHRPLR